MLRRKAEHQQAQRPQQARVGAHSRRVGEQEAAAQRGTVGAAAASLLIENPILFHNIIIAIPH